MPIPPTRSDMGCNPGKQFVHHIVHGIHHVKKALHVDNAVCTFGIVECVVKKSFKIVYQSACQVCVVNVHLEACDKIPAVHAQRIFVRDVDISVAFLYSDHHAHHGIVRGTKPDYGIADSTYANRFPEGIFSQEKCFRKSIVNQADGNRCHPCPVL